MTGDAEIPPLAPELAQALGLLRASHEMYREILSAIQESVSGAGDPDVEKMVVAFHRTLTGFAPRDHEIRGLLDKFDA